jgi:hypothetical protein
MAFDNPFDRMLGRQAQQDITVDALSRLSRANAQAQVGEDASLLNKLRDSDGYVSAKQAQNTLINLMDMHDSSRKTPIVSDVSRQLQHIADMGFYARPTRFSFMIDGIPSDVNSRIVRNCTNLSMPGRSFMTQGFKIYGNPRDQVYETNYSNEISMTLRVGEDMMERHLFESWMNLSMAYETADVAYPDDYMTSMKIYQLNRRDGYVYGVRLNSVFCKTISDMELSSDSADQVSTVQITLGYSDYAVIGRINPDREVPPNQGRNGGRTPIQPIDETQKTKGAYAPDQLMKLLRQFR